MAITCSCSVTGSGPALFLIHGIGARRATFAGLVEALTEQGHEVRAIVGQPYYPEWRAREGHGGWSSETHGTIRICRVPHALLALALCSAQRVPFACSQGISNSSAFLFLVPAAVAVASNRIHRWMVAKRLPRDPNL